MQALYREWLALLPQLEAAQTEWQRAAALIAQLDDFYAHEYARAVPVHGVPSPDALARARKIGRASCRERV